MELYPYQQRVKALIQSGKSVILQAPTGSGKTRAALAPFIEAYFDLPAAAFPRKCIYSVPMRVLANQFVEEYQKLAESYQRLHHQQIDVKIQTGERPDDPAFLGDLIFATIDQSLSSALGVPYSQSMRRANLNAGAFFSSYLVFDEFHLFPNGENGAEGALVTTLQLLSSVKNLLPFVLMTATFSSTMLGELAERLGAEVVTLTADEYHAIAAGKTDHPRRRTYVVEDDPLSADTVLARHHETGVSRSIVICNQVGRAQDLYAALREHPLRGNAEIMLLHSRFTQADRQAKEDLLRREFGKKADERTMNSLILIATQVIEVGVDITCDRMHTEIAPANSIFQRAGRCARYPGEKGVVFIYPAPLRKKGKSGEMLPDYLPYPKALCETAWQSFARRSKQEIDFLGEQEVVDEVHTEADRALLAAMDNQQSLIWEDIYAALERHDASTRSRLIRHIDSITLVAAHEPEEVGNPFLAQGFSLHRGSVKGLWRTINEYAAAYAGAEFEDAPWTMAYPTARAADEEDAANVERYAFQRLTGDDSSLLDAAPVVVVNSLFCAYDGELGFRTLPPGEAEPWASKAGTLSQGNRPRPYAYRLESYTEHIARMIAVYEERFADDYAYLQQRLHEEWGLPPDGLNDAIRIAIAVHDSAKLDTRWQRWVSAYQAAINTPIAANYLAVHTDYNPSDPAHGEARKIADRAASRPHHAGESAVAAARIVQAELTEKELTQAALTAVARHHTTSTSTYGDFVLHAGAVDELNAALRIANMEEKGGVWRLQSERGGKLDKLLVQPQDFQGGLLYFWIVRMLRLCDGLSQEF
ncbi:MAG: CRISPR-associated helicase Cas3' [Caldilineaceae bacterium]|nr:CRISPR-associated helicase Cas3' [Caldilineaceae bacterium]